jgi:hypothetical protein
VRKDDDACKLSKTIIDAGITHMIAQGYAARENFSPCIDGQVSITWDLEDGFNDLFDGRSQQPIQDAVAAALDSLSRKSIDTIALPPKAWTDKQMNSYIAHALKDLMKQGKVKQVALSGAMSSKVLQKILKVKHKPDIWLSRHDDCSQITSSTLEIADKAALPIIGYGSPCGSVLDFVAAKESLSPHALLGRWTAELGMHIAFTNVKNVGKVMAEITKGGPLSTESWRLLSSTASLSRMASLASAKDFEDGFGLKPVIEHVKSLATNALSETPQAQGFLNEEVWKSLEEDKAKFIDNDFIIYMPNFLAPDVYQKVLAESKHLWKSADIEPNCNLDGTNRIGGYVLDPTMRESSLYHLFYGNEEFRQWISRINGHMMFPSDFPIELREYPSGSKGMGCHRDLLMFTNATLDLEFVYTIDNFGTCISDYTNRRGEKTDVHTEANSLIMVRPNAALHCVKPSTGGHRTILKFIYVGDHRKSDQFHHYTANECPQSNPNVRNVLERRNKEEL